MNRSWSRGTRVTDWPGDAERSIRLWQQMKHEQFLCDTCGQMHELVEHRECRAAETAKILAGRPLVQQQGSQNGHPSAG
jgi:hypothetical protein